MKEKYTVLPVVNDIPLTGGFLHFIMLHTMAVGSLSLLAQWW